MILCEFDESKEAIINPWDLVRKEVRVKGEMPKIAVCCFEGKMFYRLVELLKGELIAATKNANGDEPIYRVTYNGILVKEGVFRADVTEVPLPNVEGIYMFQLWSPDTPEEPYRCIKVLVSKKCPNYDIPF